MAILSYSYNSLPSVPLLAAAASSSSSSASFPALAITANALSRSRKEFNGLPPKQLTGLLIKTSFILRERSAVIIVKASDGTGSVGADPPPESVEVGADPPVGSVEADVPVDKLPLESKLQLKLEQKLRMKLAKKIRLRRKRLVRKRHLRKKGRWPPSKMKKNKNV